MHRYGTAMHRYGTAGLLGLAILGITRAALAGDIPGDASTKATLQVTNVDTEGRFETRRDSDWYRVQLATGQDYAVRLAIYDSFGSVTLRDAAREPLKKSPGDYQGDTGFEVRAPYTGTYFVEVKGQWLSGITSPEPYFAAVVHDCKDGLNTRCTLVPGTTYHYGSAWYGDYDGYAAVLDRTKRYTFTGTTPPYGICVVHLQLLDGTGRVIIPTTHWAIKDYKPPQSGKYYLRANCDSDDYGGRYDLLMTVR
jgi:hypothetical protein